MSKTQTTKISYAEARKKWLALQATLPPEDDEINDNGFSWDDSLENAGQHE